MYRSSLLFFLLAILVLVSCKNAGTGEAPSIEQENCPELDSLYRQMEKVEVLLMAETLHWESLKPELDHLYNNIQHNLNTNQGKQCFFLDNYSRPSRDRFYFIELLTEVTIQQHLEAGILYLIKFRGLFIQDKEITEFISEDLAHVAFHNPTVYLAYLKHNICIICFH